MLLNLSISLKIQIKTFIFLKILILNMEKVKRALNNIKKRIKPKQEEYKKTNKILNEVRQLVENQAKKSRIKCEFFVGGSFAKNTWLSGDHDIDVFLRFEKQKDISKTCYKLLKKIFKKIEIVHGSRDYFRIKYKKYTFEFVPVLLIKSIKEAENITDASPFHVLYVKEKIKKNPNIAEEIRLLKKFCKANKIYGAETWIGGFSGYVCELLICHSKSFINLLKKTKKWKPKVFIDLTKTYKSKYPAIKKLGKHKSKSPIILIDPTERKRNAAAGLTYEKFSEFLFSANLFLLNPSARFFKEKKFSLDKSIKKSKKRGTKLIYYKIKIPDEKLDVYFSKLKRKLKRIKSRLEKECYYLYNYCFKKINSKVIICFEFKNWEVSKYKRHFGPPVWVDKKYFNDFIKKWKSKTYVFENKLAVNVKRKKKLNDLLKDLLREYDII